MLQGKLFGATLLPWANSLKFASMIQASLPEIAAVDQKVTVLQKMIPQENFDTCPQDDSIHHMGKESIWSETMGTLPGVGQHHDDKKSADHPSPPNWIMTVKTEGL